MGTRGPKFQNLSNLQFFAQQHIFKASLCINQGKIWHGIEYSCVMHAWVTYILSHAKFAFDRCMNGMGKEAQI